MPELRKDPVVGRWVIISTERAKRPKDFVAQTVEESNETACPFCEGQESQTPTEIFALRRHGTAKNTPGWDVRVVPSIAPILKVEGNLDRRGKGMCDMMNGIGAHEIVIETPKHASDYPDLDEEQIAKVIMVSRDRIVDLSRDIRFKYVLFFRNHGLLAGASAIRHSRSQLMALPVNPKRVKEKLIGARKYFEYKERCIFCDIIKQEKEQSVRIADETSDFIAITPFASRFPFELCIYPKEHSPDFTNIKKHQIGDLAKILKRVTTKLKTALNDPPYNLTLHSAPFKRMTRSGYWKTVDDDFHWHIEILPSLTRVAGFEWGTGFYINPTPPEEAAKYLKEIEV